MVIELKYFKYTDPQSGIIKKDMGYVYDRIIREYSATVGSLGEPVEVKKDNKFRKVSTHLPNVDGLIEIGKEEFDSIPLDNLPVLDQFAYYRKFSALHKRADRVNQAEVTSLNKEELSQGGTPPVQVPATISKPTYITEVQTVAATDIMIEAHKDKVKKFRDGDSKTPKEPKEPKEPEVVVTPEEPVVPVTPEEPIKDDKDK
jgi:hypothetical protein